MLKHVKINSFVQSPIVCSSFTSFMNIISKIRQYTFPLHFFNTEKLPGCQQLQLWGCPMTKIINLISWCELIPWSTSISKGIRYAIHRISTLKKWPKYNSCIICTPWQKLCHNYSEVKVSRKWIAARVGSYNYTVHARTLDSAAWL